MGICLVQQVKNILAKELHLIKIAATFYMIDHFVFKQRSLKIKIDSLILTLDTLDQVFWSASIQN